MREEREREGKRGMSEKETMQNVKSYKYSCKKDGYVRLVVVNEAILEELRVDGDICSDPALVGVCEIRHLFPCQLHSSKNYIERKKERNRHAI